MEVFEPDRQAINRIRQQPGHILQVINQTDSNRTNKLGSLLGLLNLEIPSHSSQIRPPTDVNPKFSGMSQTLFSSGWANPRAIFRDHVIELTVRILVSLTIMTGICFNADFSKGLALIFLMVSLFYLEINFKGIVQDSPKHDGRKQKHLFDLVHALCYFVYFLGAILYFSELISGLSFFICGILYCLFGIGLSCFPVEKDSYYSHRKLIIFEALQLMLITLKLCQISPLGWTLTLMPFGVAAFYFTILGVFMKILLMMSVALRGLPSQDMWLIKSMFWESWDFFSTGLSYLLIIKGVGLYYDQKVVKFILKEKIVFLSDPSCLCFGCLLLLAVSVLSLLMCQLWKASIVDYFRKVIYKDVLMKEITQDELNQCHQVSLRQISPTYFMKNSPSDIIQNEKAGPNEVCAFCFDKETNILFDPCGHGGICKECALSYLKDRDRNCPFCKQSIDEVFVIELDSDQQIFKTKAQIIFNF